MTLKCDACPCADLPYGCPAHARPHVRFCQLAKTRPEYREVIRALCESDAAPLDLDRRPEPPPEYKWRSGPAGDRRIRYGVIGAMIGCGGAERWSYDVVRAIGDEHLFVGYAYEGIQTCQNTADEARALGPLYIGHEAMRSLAEHCDVVLAWGVHDLVDILPEPRPCKVIGVSQGNGVWTQIAFDTMGRLDHAVTVSHECKEFMHGWEDKAQVIYNTYDPKRVFCEPIDLRAEWRIDPDEYVFGYIGRFSGEKNPAAFVRFAAAMMRLSSDSYFNCRFVMAGEGKGNQEEDTIELAQELGVFDRFVFPGWRGDIGNVLDAIDVMIQPSLEEGCSLAVVEAWAKRVPVVATEIAVVLDFPQAVWPLKRDPSGEDILAVVERMMLDPARIENKRQAGYDIAHTGPCSPDAFARSWKRTVKRVACSTATGEPVRLLHDAIHACPHRGEKVGCGCNGRHVCRAGKGRTPGEVFYHDCVACVSEPKKAEEKILENSA